MATATGSVWHVSSVAALKSAISSATAGDTISIAAGDYDVSGSSGIAVNRSLHFVSEGGQANFHATVPVTKGIFTVGQHVARVSFDGLGFFDARNGDLNGAGIRHQGGDLTVENCYFSNNQNGILGYAGTGYEGDVVISNSEFDGNGWTNGLAHGIYIYSESLLVENSYFHDTVTGHHIKSVAASNVIRGNVLDDANANASRSLDVTGGGDLLVEHNTMIKSSASSNAEFILYDDYRTSEGPGDVLVQDNEVVNHRGNGMFVINQTSAVAAINENDFTNIDIGKLAVGPNVHEGNVFDGVSEDPVGEEGPFAPTGLSNLALWLDGSDAGSRVDTGSDGDVDAWRDLSGRGNDASQSGGSAQPTIDASGAFGGLTSIAFDGANDVLAIADDPTLNSGATYSGKTLTLAFQTGGDVTSRQVLYEEGGVVRGLNLYLDGGEVHVGGWNLNGSTWGPSFVSGAVAANTGYVVTLTLDGTAGTLSGHLNGVSMGSVAGAGSLQTHAADIGLGALRQDTVFADGVSDTDGTGFFFEGRIGEAVFYNQALSDTERGQVETYLSDKWLGGSAETTLVSTTTGDSGYSLSQEDQGGTAPLSTVEIG